MTRRAVRDKTYDVKGDIFVATADDTATRVPIGTDGYVLTADSSATTGVAWKAGVAALDWQESVIDKDLLAAPAAGAGDRYIVGSPIPGGDPWTGHEYDIAEYDGTGWDFLNPDNGTACYVEDEAAFYVWTGAAWVQMWAKETISLIAAGGPTAMVSNHGYVANNAGATVRLVLPAASLVGDYLLVVGRGAGGWTVEQGAGQTIYFEDLTTTAGVTGYIGSTLTRDVVKLICVTDNLDWSVVYSEGEIQVV